MTPKHSSPSPNHLVCSLMQGAWYGATECLSGLEVDHKLVLRRRLHRNVSGLLAIEDAVDVACGKMVWVDCIMSVGNQTASSDEEALRVDRRQAILGGRLNDRAAMNDR